VRFRIRQRAEEAGRLSEEISLAESFLFVDLT
jgi:hypothetical protein